MGFSDTMKGLGRAVGGFISQAIDIAGPPLVDIGAQWLMQKATGGQSGQYQSKYGTLPIPYAATPYGGYAGGSPYGAAPAYRPIPQANPVPYTPQSAYAPQTMQRPVPQAWRPLSQGGYAPAAAPGGYGGGYTNASWDMPSIIGGAMNLFGGESAMPAVVTPGTQGGGFGTELMERLRGAVGGQTTMYQYGGESVRAVREIQAVNPKTGKIGIWRYMGHPILYSGDLATCKRVARISRRVARRRPR